MPKPAEHKSIQARLLQYAHEIGWTYVTRAVARRGFPPHPGPLPQGTRENADEAQRASFYFGDLLSAQVLAFNPRYKDAEGARMGEFHGDYERLASVLNKRS